MWSRLTHRNLISRIHRYLTTLAYVFQTIHLSLAAVSTIILNITFINAINKLRPVTGVITSFQNRKVYSNYFFLQKQSYGLQYDS